MLGHPPRTGKMTVVDTSGALTISVRIEAKPLSELLHHSPALGSLGSIDR